MLRYVGLDVHKEWTQVARHLADGSVQRERVATNAKLLRDFADTLGPEDVVALESTTNALAVARVLGTRAGLPSHTRRDTLPGACRALPAAVE